MDPSWTDVTQAIAGVVTVLVAVAGFLLIIRQIRQLERSIRGATHGALYDQQFEVTKIFIENSELRAYFYGNRRLSPEADEYEKVLAVAELVADFCEHVCLQQDNLPESIWPRWVDYIRFLYLHSPALQSHLRENGEWYGIELMQVVSYADSFPEHSVV